MEILKPQKIDLFLVGGCLLGAVRQGSFAGRPSDIDFGIKEDTLLRKTIKKMGGVLDDITFSIDRGEIVSLNGPSGSGKSTLIKILLCMYIPEKGNIFFNGKSVYNDILEWQKK